MIAPAPHEATAREQAHVTSAPNAVGETMPCGQVHREAA